MGKILLYLILALTTLFTLINPFIGVSAYYLLAILGPQYIWWWVFGTARISFLVGGITLVSIFSRLLTGRLNTKFLFTKINFFIFLLWLAIAISYFFGPYVDDPRFKIFPPDKLFIDSIKIFFFYLLSSLVISDFRKIKLFSLIIVFSALYLTYWANMQYINHNWHQFNMGRLQGPISIYGTSIYKDENVFAMLFVTAIPFLAISPLLLDKYFKPKILRFSFWLSIPFSIHAIFLTASRGGLLGLFSISFCASFFSRKKIFFIFLVVPLLILFYNWQAGDIMKHRSETIEQYQQESSAQQRLHAWIGGLRMIEKYPITGVGLGSFITALPDFYPTNPRVAHNTLIQFTAESGLLAGFSYIMIIILFYKNSFYILRRLNCFSEDQDIFHLKMINIANTISFTGLIICSIFLSLNFYEIFFYLLLINNNSYQLLKA